MKMRQKLIVFCTLSFVLFGCSKFTQKKEESNSPDIEMTENDELVGAEPIVADDATEGTIVEDVVIADDEVTQEAVTPTESSETTDSLVKESVSQANTNESTLENPTSLLSNNLGSDRPRGKYKVAKDETLMMIAFKIYGDYRKWRSIQELNSGKVKGTKILAGTTIDIIEPEVRFEWNASGNPYLIKNGDTLGLISNSVYGNQKNWKALWENNKPLIRDPNKIYAGFTIYWKELNKIAAGQF